MALTEKETVVVRDDVDRIDRSERTMGSWLIPLAVVILLILAFFYFGGFNMFSGSTSDSDTINIDTPDNVQVQPNNTQVQPDDTQVQPTNP